jgi:hypothetical protein
MLGVEAVFRHSREAGNPAILDTAEFCPTTAA